MVNKILGKYWELIVIAILSIALIWIVGSWRAETNRADRMTDNFENLSNNPDRQIEYLTKSELKEIHKSLLDSIKKHIPAINKAKDIHNITTVKEYYIDSSKTVYMPYEIKKGLYDISYVSECFGFSGTFNVKDTIVNLKDKWFTNQIEIVVYDDKAHWFKKKWLPRWFMKKTVKVESYDKCNSKKIIQKTTIIK
jgi:hypothetical protein